MSAVMKSAASAPLAATPRSAAPADTLLEVNQLCKHFDVKQGLLGRSAELVPTGLLGLRRFLRARQVGLGLAVIALGRFGGALQLLDFEQRLLETLFEWSARSGVAHLWLETNEAWHAAHHIYEKHGFRPVSRDSLPPEFPVVRVATGFYHRAMTPDASRRLPPAQR